jgi:hypothetical protein
MKTIFLRALEADDKAAALRLAIHKPEVTLGRQRFEVDTANFSTLPGQPFAYWISAAVRRCFHADRTVAKAGITTKCGLGTLDDFRFLTLVKGGESSAWYADLSMMVSWGVDGRELKQFVEDKVGSASRKIQAQDYYGRAGITWSRRPHKRGWFRVAPAQAIFSDNGPMAFGSASILSTILPLLNSLIANFMMQTMMSRGQGDSGQTLTYEVGVVDNLPLPDSPLPQEFALCSERAWSLQRRVDTRTEVSHAFTVPALLLVEGDTLAARAVTWAEHVRTIEAELAAIQSKIDARCFDLYGIDEPDRRAITEGFGGGVVESGGSADTDAGADAEASPEADPETDDQDDTESRADAKSLAAELVSWAAGVAFGRFDVRLATGVRALPAEPKPFDALPVCSPAMLTGENGLPLSIAPDSYPLTFPENGILVDDLGHRSDLTTAVRAVFDEIFGANADSWWQEAAALLAPKDHDLRAWLASGFFEHHLKRHSRSRRKAPVLWQLGVPSGRYSVWLYAHRLTRDSFFQLQNDVVAPKLAHEERQLTSLVQTTGGSPSAKERKEIAEQKSLVEELRALLDEVRRVAPLWNPTLDDGVVLTMAPLWRLVPQHKPWQKELKSKWGELAAGKYDWAHLAMHLWPERVIPKCATDRSLAIAHELDGVFWVDADDGKWKSRPAPTHSIEELVRERTSSAVKAAMKSLLEAPVATAEGRRGRRRAEPSV